jgi:cardiolipin synthase
VNLANRLTVLRILLVPVFIASLLYYTPEKHFFYSIALGLFLLACVTDGLDGYLARKMSEKTELGSYIDPLADKVLLLSGFLSLSLMTHLPSEMRVPAWVTIPIISRDVVILMGSAIVFIATGSLEAKPLFIGKITTVAQMMTLFLSLLKAPFILRESFYFLVVGLTIWSGILYIGMGGRMFQKS